MAKTLVSRRHAILASLALGVGSPAAEAQPLAQLPAKQGSREMDSSHGTPARARFTILWSKPKDVDAFERHYREVHVPLAKKMPGLRRYTLSMISQLVDFGTYTWSDGSHQCVMESSMRYSESHLITDFLVMLHLRHETLKRSKVG